MTSPMDDWKVRLAYRWSRAKLPRALRVQTWAGVWEDPRWSGEGFVESRMLDSGYLMRNNISDWYQRAAHFWGRYHELPLLVFMQHGLRAGDVFVDVGANFGLVSLWAAHLVGPGGEVHCFEPNPECYERVAWHKEVNKLDQMHLHPVALSDSPGEFVLRVPGTNTGAGTLGGIPARYGGHISGEYRVQVRVGDEVLAGAKRSPSIIKLDVEGHEWHALHGFEGFLKDRRPAIATEINREMLPENGKTAGDLFQMLFDLGYKRFLWDVKRSGLRGKRLELHRKPAHWPKQHVYDAAWIHPESVHWERFRGLMIEPDDLDGVLRALNSVPVSEREEPVEPLEVGGGGSGSGSGDGAVRVRGGGVGASAER